MELTDLVIQKILTRLINGQDYRVEILTLINAAFLQYVIDFFKQIVEAKSKNREINTDWYKEEFLENPLLTSKQITINAGLNHKTISNMYNSATRKIVLEVTSKYYDELYQSIGELAERSSEIDVLLQIKFQDAIVELNISESLIVINTIAVKRAELRGGAWSVVGKRVEKYLMLTLCALFSVPAENYVLTGLTSSKREVDFFLISGTTRYQCEVKLMGKGNPESADAVIARDTQIFVADKLSNLNKQQLDSLNIRWVELRSENGFRKFYSILKEIGIACRDLESDLDEALPAIFAKLFPV